ncbi:hypothetical protein [Nocardia sp. NBC_00511]|uniref:hypothetical protein n=1 Tax=Nocardia sp. NBC_00511 TaxID=2903591 RepID=UPI0030E58AA1
MGLIRKTLMIATGGAVRGSSKKQRVARAQLNELRKQTSIAEQQAKNIGNSQPMPNIPAVSGSQPPTPMSFRPGRIPPITARSGSILIRFDGAVIDVSQPAGRSSIPLGQLESATLTRAVFGKSKLEFRIKDDANPVLVTLGSDHHQFDRLIEKIYLHGVTA